MDAASQCRLSPLLHPPNLPASQYKEWDLLFGQDEGLPAKHHWSAQDEDIAEGANRLLRILQYTTRDGCVESLYTLRPPAVRASLSHAVHGTASHDPTALRSR